MTSLQSVNSGKTNFFSGHFPERPESFHIVMTYFSILAEFWSQLLPPVQISMNNK